MSEKNRDPKSGLPTYDYKTSNYIENIIALLSQKKWPNPTREFIECNIRYTCVEDTCAGRVNKKYDIEIIDCPGDYFEAAFCSEASQSDHLLQKANQLKELIRNCNHVCYFIDANTLFSGIETRQLRQSMEGLFEYMLNDLSDHVGLTILLNKGEGIEESYPEVLSLLKLKYSNAYQLMKNKLDDCNSSYLLRPLSTFSFDEKRNAISLKEKESHDFLAPFNFTLGLDHYFITWVKERRLRREQEEKEQKENEKRLFERGLNKGVFLMKQNTWTRNKRLRITGGILVALIVIITIAGMIEWCRGAIPYWIGRCYHDGYIVEENQEKAIKWLRKAAEQGDKDAMYALGICYCKGEGVERDLFKAVEWYSKATGHGYSEAQKTLETLSNP